MSVRELDYGNVPKMMAEAREMQVNGRYINGTVFHTLADEIDRLRGVLTEIAEHPGPNADDAAWARVECAREALKSP